MHHPGFDILAFWQSGEAKSSFKKGNERRQHHHNASDTPRYQRQKNRLEQVQRNIYGAPAGMQL